MTYSISRESSHRKEIKTGEIIFEVTAAVEGGYNARALGHSIFTQGKDWCDLKEMTRDAVLCHFDESGAPKVIRLHLVTQEMTAVCKFHETDLVMPLHD